MRTAGQVDAGVEYVELGLDLGACVLIFWRLVRLPNVCYICLRCLCGITDLDHFSFLIDFTPSSFLTFGDIGDSDDNLSDIPDEYNNTDFLHPLS